MQNMYKANSKVLITLFAFFWYYHYFSGNVYLFKVNNGNTRKRFEICSKLAIKAPERYHDMTFTVKFEHISQFFLVSLLLTLNK